MLFAVCADRGAPGATTTALALAAARGLPAVVVEADPFGGALALRIGRDGKRALPTTPTVLGVGAGRSGQSSLGVAPQNGPAQPRQRDLWRDGAHRLTDLVKVVPGFMTAEQGIPVDWPVLAGVLGSQSVPVFADLGRIHTGSPSMPIATAADALIVVCRGDMGSVQHMVDRLELLVPAIAERKGRPPLVVPVVVAPRQHGVRIAASIHQILAETAVAPVLGGVGWLAWDPGAVTLLENAAHPWTRPLKKSPLMRSARTTIQLLGQLSGLEHTEPASGEGRAASAADRPPTGDSLSMPPGAVTETPAHGATKSQAPAHRPPPSGSARQRAPVPPPIAGSPHPMRVAGVSYVERGADVRIQSRLTSPPEAATRAEDN